MIEASQIKSDRAMDTLWALAVSGAVALGSLVPLRAEIVIEGTVKLPPAKASAASASRYQQKAGVVSAAEQPVAVVYLEGSFQAKGSSSSNLEQVSQENYQFRPGLLAVQRGSKVEFPNHDDDYHHVFSYSKTKEFDLGRYRKGEKPPAIAFDKMGVVKVGCEIHDHMRAIVLVLDTPHFSKTDPAGKYRLELKDVPAGTYTLKAWINEKTTWEQPVELKEGAILQADFSAK
jgi:plastocyanin